MITKTRRMNDLLDWYEDLLTQKQKEIMHLYYQQDLSLREIADELSISHNAVFDSISRASKRLEEFEKHVQALDLYQHLQTLIIKLKEKDIEEIKDIVNEMEKL